MPTPKQQGNVIFDSASELNFATHLLHTLGARPVKYNSTYQPELDAPLAPLPQSSRPFPLRKFAKPASSTDITLQIKALKANINHTITVSRIATISAVKASIAKLGDVPISSQRLIWKGKALTDSKTLLDYGIESGETIHLLKKVGVADDDPAAAATTENVPAVTDSGIAKVGMDKSFWAGVATYLQSRLGAESPIVYSEFVKAYEGLISNKEDKDALKTASTV
ncbi:hypothetical protein SmJEL517_g01043 [Synchytrium microbalum]|uniref:Ubiquitin-like domain-containing protein n=1 Tax=Synchytrium microbalum TaxID=1806994 RepID=A0A507CH61_9FUNG|nr:uncharacterized protein SmJEL517_g01043 [Synchytrium microbalum]TPX36995.1 hypothetical protein SmJEL517_g01043 [Synchytrium microbalum]